MTTSSFQTRFASAQWLNKKITVAVLGIGAAGHQLAVTLASYGYNVIIADKDTVGAENVIPQRFSIQQIGMSKVNAARFNLKAITGDFKNITELDDEAAIMSAEIVVSAVDSMKRREELFNLFAQSNAKMFIDMRLGAEQAQMITILKKEGFEEAYMKYMFPDSDAAQLPCTMKMTPHVADIMRGFCICAINNFTLSKDANEDIYALPEHIAFNALFFDAPMCMTYEDTTA